MLIHCPECRTGFRFEKRWMRGYKGARVRCRNCGSMIVILNPAMSPVSPPRAAGPAGPPESAAPGSGSGIRERTSGEDPTGDRMGQGDPSLWPVYNNGGETQEQPGSGDSGATEESAGAPPESEVSPEIRVEAGGKETAGDGFDISERIAVEPDPDEFPTGQEEFSPPSAFREPRPSFPEDDVYAPLVEVLPPLQGEEWPPPNSSPGAPPSLGYSPRPSYKVITDFALITVILVFGGVCGYFALRYILNVIGVDLG
jgi:predicted Zn finger-like uncharacterized protein